MVVDFFFIKFLNYNKIILILILKEVYKNCFFKVYIKLKLGCGLICK